MQQAVLVRQASDRPPALTLDAASETRTEALFNLVMADLHLSALEQCLPGLSAGSRSVDEGMEMLETSAQLGALLTRYGGDMQSFVERMEKARQGLEDIQVKKMAGAAARYQLNGASGAFEAGDVRLPNVVLPSSLQCRPLGIRGIAEAKLCSANNLSSLPRIAEGAGTLTPERVDDIATWATHDRVASGGLPLQLVLREVEVLLFETAARHEFEIVAENFKMSGDTSKLDKLVNVYRSVLRTFLSTSSSCGRMLVELRSRETLVVWIAYAVSFAVTRATYSVQMATFGVALSFGDLKNLVLSDKMAVDAAINLADYLRRYTLEEEAIFTLADGGRATFSLAAQVARERVLR